MPQTYEAGGRPLSVIVTAWVSGIVAAPATVSALVRNAAAGPLLAGLPDLLGPPLVTSPLIGRLPWVVGAEGAPSLVTLGACALLSRTVRLSSSAQAGPGDQPVCPST